MINGGHVGHSSRRVSCSWPDNYQKVLKNTKQGRYIRDNLQTVGTCLFTYGENEWQAIGDMINHNRHDWKNILMFRYLTLLLISNFITISTVWMYEASDCDNDIDGTPSRKHMFVVRWTWKIPCLFLVLLVGVKEYYTFSRKKYNQLI